MAEQWVSTGKRFCEICKVWFGNNKASQDHHDRGERHKAMLQQRIRETMQKGKKQELADAKLNGTLARMEAAAAASMSRNGEGIVAGPSLPSTGLRMNIFDPNKHKDVGSMAREMASRREAGAMKRGAAAPAGAAPDLKISKGDVVSAYRDLTNPNAAGPALPEHLAVGYLPETQTQCAEISWVRARNPDGPGHYYWNLFDNSTRWDTPNHFYTEQQYEEKCREFEEQRKKNYYGMDEVQAVRSGKNDVSAFIKSQLAKNGMAEQVEANRKEQNYTDRPRKGQKLTKEEKKALWKEKCAERERKRREEEAKEEEDVEEDDEDDYSDEEDVDDEEEEFEIVGTPEREAMMDQEKDMMLQAPPPPPEEEEAPEPEKVPEIGLIEPPKPSIPTPGNPFGAWVRVTKEEKQEVFESPLTARFREEEAQREEEEEKKRAEEPKFEFGEKTATVMTKKVKGPIEFKKKAGGRNIRKRED
ncbi:Protein CBG08044 [Caenorhabditis briggsae]|uniref:Protein CBG08044 n=1 Tax=Caenorhabditis briggsae TaxID=6238 RepID=A8X5N4_CAEBR|nr:Protein CBG08044 [Caenorhabditis briggsae]CAP27945.1 Protein CBG08044 [Caenorhabditis briggsae]